FEHADQNLPIEAVLVIESKSGAPRNQNPVGELRREELVGHRNGLVENVVKQFQLSVEDEEETNTGLVEDRPEKSIVGAECACGRHDLRKIVQFEDDRSA